MSNPDERAWNPLRAMAARDNLQRRHIKSIHAGEFSVTVIDCSAEY